MDEKKNTATPSTLETLDFLTLLPVTQYIFLFKKDVLCVTTVVLLFLRFCLNIRKLKCKYIYLIRRFGV